MESRKEGRKEGAKGERKKRRGKEEKRMKKWKNQELQVKNQSFEREAENNGICIGESRSIGELRIQRESSMSKLKIKVEVRDLRSEK
jgi:hypothetical protein